jgi:hypothetical protein
MNDNISAPGTSPEERGDNILTGLPLSESQLAQDNWARYQYGRQRGHSAYVMQAQKCERFYIGYQKGICDGQWDPETRQFLEGARRPVQEMNFVQPIIETITGQQIQSRTEIAYQPRWGEASQQVADTLTQLVMQLCDDNKVQYLETEVFRDGQIEQRGYTDIRMDFSDNIMGDVRETLLDPRDVIPDPDANTYEPDGWKDVIYSRFLSIDEIEQFYGNEAARKVENYNPIDQSFGSDDRENSQESRNSFGNQGNRWYDAYIGEDRSTRRVRVVDRQFRVYTMVDFFLNTTTGDLRPVPDKMDREAVAKKLLNEGLVIHRRMSFRVRWRVTTMDLVLFDEWSPYKSFTINPYFPYFRRGKTKGAVDNLISPSELVNKSLSSELHILNSTANSGWNVEEGSLANMDPEDLEDTGANTGLVIVYKKDTTKPEKIQPNQIPAGLDRMSDRGRQMLKEIGGVPDALQGQPGAEVSGNAIESKQFGAQLQQQGPLQNLARTREMRARKYLELVQQFYTTERVILVRKNDNFGKPQPTKLVLNKWTPEGEIINNLTLGEYDVVVDSVPASATFQNSQFKQALDMKKEGINIPDRVLIMSSNLSKKSEIAREMEPDPAASDIQKRSAEAKIKLDEATAADRKAASVQKNITAIYSGVQAAQVLTTIPQVAQAADQLLLSGGFEDQDKPPIVTGTGLPALTGPGVQGNTSPAFPPVPQSAAAGLDRGIETQEMDGVR